MCLLVWTEDDVHIIGGWGRGRGMGGERQTDTF